MSNSIIPFSNDKIEELIEKKKFIKNTFLKWKIENNRYILETPVTSIDDEILELKCWLGKTNFGFTLLYKNYALRRYNKHAKHKNSDGTKITTPHKHTLDANTFESDAYIPDDINPDDDINEKLFDFLNECNIILENVDYQKIIWKPQE